MKELALVKLTKSIVGKVGEKIAAKKKVWAEQAAISVEENKRREAEFKADLSSAKEKINVTAIKEEIQKGVEATTKKVEELKPKGLNAKDIADEAEKKYNKIVKPSEEKVLKEVEKKPTPKKKVVTETKKVEEKTAPKTVAKPSKKEAAKTSDTTKAKTTSKSVEKSVEKKPVTVKKAETAPKTVAKPKKEEPKKAPTTKETAPKKVAKVVEKKSSSIKSETKPATKKTTAKKAPVKATEKKVVAKKESVKETEKSTTPKKKASPSAKPATKREEKLALYSADITKHYGKVDEDFLAIIVKNLGPSIYKKNSELVACSDSKELDTVRVNFLVKKLNMKENDDILNAAIKEVCEELKASRNKYRATFYYALAKKLKQESKLK